MGNTTISNDTIAQRLLILSRLYQSHQPSEVTIRTLEKLLAYETDLSRKQLAQLDQDLAEYEGQYGQLSADFYQRYQAGQADDRFDFVEWAALIQMRNNLLARLQTLTGESVS